MIRILARRNEKGKLFEVLLKTVLARQGYGIIQMNVHQTGSEIDIKAKDNLSNAKISIEAKAHKTPLGTPELKKFLQTASTDKNKKRMDHAIFWSLSGINGTARAYYEDEVESRIKKFTSIKDDSEFQKSLEELGLIGNENSITNRIKNLVKKNLIARDLIYYQNKWYFIQYCSDSEKITHYFILDSFGNVINDILAKEIRQQITQLKKLSLILFSTRKKILPFLMNVENATTQEIIKGIEEENVDIDHHLEELIAEKIILKSNETPSKISIKHGLETFLKIARGFLENKDKKSFMSSSYFVKSLNDEQTISFIKSRFYLNPSNEELLTILRMCSVSPTALHHVLFSSDKGVRNLVEQFKGKITSAIYKENLRSLVSDLCLWVLSDYKNFPVLGSQDTKAISVDVGLKLATKEDLFFSVESHFIYQLARAAKGIKFGEMVKASNPELFLELANILVHFKEEKKAIEQIDKAFQLFENKGEWVYTALTNKGIILHQLGELKDAERCFRKSRRLFPNKEEILLNYALLLIDLGKISSAKSKLKKALKLRENDSKVLYALARIAILEKDKERTFKLLEDTLKLERRFVERIDSDIEFKKLKKTKRYQKLIQNLGV